MKKLIRNRLSAKCTALLLIMAMLFSVTCVFPAYSEGETASRSLVSGTNFADGVYVLNNRLTGKFLASPGTSTLDMISGKMSVIRYDVQFSIRYVAGGCYDIRLTSTSLYLTRSSTTSNKNVTLQSSPNSNYSFWKIESNTYNGQTYHYFKNAQTNEYLTWQNGSLQVTSTLSYEGSESFYACSWRVAKSSDYVEPTSISIDDMWLPYGTSKQPTVQTTPSGADLCEPYDFTYTFDSAYIELDDELHGLLTPYSNAGTYTKTVTATHKPTGISTTFLITTNPKGILVGVDAESNHDHISCLNTVAPDIVDAGYGSAIVEVGDFVKNDIDSYLDSNRNSIFISRSHGQYFADESNVLEATGILLSSGSEQIWYRSDEMSTLLDLSNMRIIAFVCCRVGYGKISGRNLPSACVSRGAKVAIGFETTINCAMANEWTIRFVDLLTRGYTVQGAVNTLDNTVYSGSTKFSVMKACVYGDGTVTLN